MVPFTHAAADAISVETMEVCLAKVRQLLDHSTEITDSEIRETLWYYYFDIDQTVSWLLGK